jgi:translation initiation factor IF-2
VLHGAVGGVNESDVQLAVASRAIIVGFGVRGEPRALEEAESLGVQVRFYRIIYELLDDVKQAMAGLLAPIKKEVSLGRAEVRDTFAIPKVGTVAGCYVQDGAIRRGAFLRLLRDSRVVHEGRMLALKRFKDDVREVQTGYECGISFDGYNDIKQGDVIEAYEIKEIAATID